MVCSGMITRRKWLAGTLAAALVPRAEDRAREPFRLGLTPVFLDNDVRLLDLLREYLEPRLQRPVQLIKRRSYQEITVLLLAGRLDAAWICGYPYVQYRRRLALVAAPLWRGAPLYRSYIIVPRGSRARALDDLRGTIHAFSDPDSNSGYLVTAALLVERGESPGSFFRHVFFTYGHRNVVRAVARRLADSGSVDGYVFEVMRAREPELTDACRILRRSREYGFPPVACRRGDAHKPSIRALRSALIDMPSSPPGRTILEILALDGFAFVSPDVYASIEVNASLLARAT